MSLYGGISFKGQAKPPSASTSPAPLAAVSEDRKPFDSPTAPQPAQTQSTETQSTDEKPKNATWSAALRFAPTARKRPNQGGAAAGARPSASALALKSAFGAAAEDDDDAAGDSSRNASQASGKSAAHAIPSGFRIATVGKAALTAAPEKAPPVNKWSAVSRPVEEIKPFASTSAGGSGSGSRIASPTTATGDDKTRPRTRARRIIANPPPMTLDDLPLSAATTPGTDVNGFAQSGAGKKLAAQQTKKRGKKKRGGNGADDPELAFADVPYDPARPCDYSAYKTHLRVMREQRRLQREEEERQRRSRRDGSYSGSSYYSEDEDEDRDRRKENEPLNKKPRFFAPPSSYDGPSSAPAFPPPASYEPPSAPSREETGDEAYARRLAMSQGGSAGAGAGLGARPPPPAFTAASMKEETGDEAYQRRVAMSQRREETGEEAYLRRMALSQGGPATGSAPPPAAPAFVSSSNPPFVPPPPPPGVVPPPAGFAPSGFAPASFVPSTSAAAPPQPPPLTFQPASAPLPMGGGGGNEALDAAQAKAREIAAKLSKLGGAFAAAPPSSAPTDTGVSTQGMNPQASAFAPASTAAGGGAPGIGATTAEPDDRSFAERMMSRFGWEEGKGLGAQESGMTSALAVQRAPATTSNTKKNKKKEAEAQQPAPTGMASRSVVVDSSREQRLAEQRAQMGGDASRVVLLTNMCARDEVDDDLPGEVAEEANKIGVVERCFVYLVPGETRDDEAVRIFLVMSGLAGGYNAVRSFDGRFFGGRTVRARFYDDRAFHTAQYDL